MSYSPSLGITLFIDPELCPLKYTAFHTVLDMITQLDHYAELGKVDIKKVHVCYFQYTLDTLCYFVDLSNFSRGEGSTVI